MKSSKIILSILFVLVLSGCVSPPPAYDYSAFRNSDPHSVLILPPINNTSEVIARYGVVSQVAVPIAESGFYVFPAALTEQTFVTNGLTVAEDIQNLPISKLKEIFGADTALYMTIEEYGTSYVVLSSETRVTIAATLVDLKTGQTLWNGASTASSAETQGSSGGGLIGALVQAAITQIVETVSDTGFPIAGIAANRLLFAEGYNNLLYGPRSPKYGQPAPSEKKN